MTAGDPTHQQIRWMPCKNVFHETAPPHALMKIEFDTPDVGGVELVGGQSVWHVSQPDGQSAGAQDPAMLAVNGPAPIRPGQYGICTQDWPVKVLREKHDTIAPANLDIGDINSLGGGGVSLVHINFGPRAGAWGVANDNGLGTAFRRVSNFPFAPGGRELKPGETGDTSVEHIWISPELRSLAPIYWLFDGGVVLDSEDFENQPGTRIPIVPTGGELLQQSYRFSGVLPNEAKQEIEIVGSGIYEISVSATIWPHFSSTMSGAVLVLALYHDVSERNATGLPGTIFSFASASRFHHHYTNDPDQYHSHNNPSRENVAVRAFQTFYRTDKLFLQNNSSVSVAISHLSFTLRRVRGFINTIETSHGPGVA